MLLDSRGRPIDFAAEKSKKNGPRPRVGDAFGQWAGRDLNFISLPGGAVMQFDLDKLTLADYRAMRQHYQIGTSLNVLSFVMHQIDWHIDCKKKSIADEVERQLREAWTQVIRGISQAFAFGFGPSAVNYKNGDKYVEIDTIKDLVPEECRVNWKRIDGWAPEGKPKPKLYKYDGMWQVNSYIPPENTLWYPLLMENGDHYGRKLLKPAFPAWFFSNLIHLFTNRYFERFGEPLPIGRAPFEETVDTGNGVYVNGKQAMDQIIQNVRNRAVATLPSDRDSETKEFLWDIEYLESQMRGVDFERYLSRLDEEMSLSVFTPILLFRTADVGSYNLGQAHLRIFQQMLNAIAGDLQYYIQHYLVDRIVALNWGPRAPRAFWMYRKQGQGDVDQYKELMNELVRQERAMPDLKELGAIVGLSFNEVEQLTAPGAEPGEIDPDADPNDPKKDDLANKEPKKKAKPKLVAARAVMDEAINRITREFGKGGDPRMGFRNRFIEALQDDGYSAQDASIVATGFYTRMNSAITNTAEAAVDTEDFRSTLKAVTDVELDLATA